MAGTDQSAERVAAGTHLMHAREQMQRGKVDRALDEAQLAVEADPTFIEARLFLAEAFERVGEPRKAVHHYEELLFKDPHNEDVMQRVERLDPMTAAKHRRLGEIAPDPFVSKGRVAVESDELADMNEMEMIDDGGLAEELEVAPEGPTDLVAMDEVPAEPRVGVTPRLEADPSVFADDGQQVADQPTAVECRVYEYEDEPQYRENVFALPVIQELLKEQRRLWATSTALDDLVAESRPLSPVESEDAHNAFAYAHSTIGAATTVPHVITDPSLRPLVCGPLSAYAVAPTGALDALGAGELYFLAGRTLARVACDHVPLLEVAAALLPASGPRSRLQELLRHTAAQAINATTIEDESVRKKAQTLLHTWRLRAELTADRAGLICCRDPRTAASAIAKLTAPDTAAAQAISPDALEQRFGGQDVGQLAAIGPEHDPEASEPYAYYRIRMLAWWSTQPVYKEFASRS